MKKINVKICGIRSIISATTAVEEGADFIGFNFVSTSSRFVSAAQAKQIHNKIRNNCKIVGVFVNEKIETINQISNIVGLDYIQLHGSEDDQFISMLIRPVIKAIAKESLMSKNASFYLLDRKVQGVGKMVDRDFARSIAHKYPVFLAGGLLVENVTDIASYVKPFGVDVASGVETNGNEDTVKIKQFIRAVKGVSS